MNMLENANAVQSANWNVMHCLLQFAFALALCICLPTAWRLRERADEFGKAPTLKTPAPTQVRGRRRQVAG